MLVLDIVVLVLVILGAYFGHKKGLVGIGVSFISLILSIVLAFVLQPVVAEALFNSGVGTSLNKTIGDSIQSKLDEGKSLDDIPYLKVINPSFSEQEEVSVVSQTVTKFILKGVSFIAIFVVVKLICYILQMILNLVFSLPILDQINGIGGIILGALSMILRVWIVLAILSFLAPLPAFEPIMTYIDKTWLIKFLYNHNFVVSILKIGLKI